MYSRSKAETDINFIFAFALFFPCVPCIPWLKGLAFYQACWKTMMPMTSRVL
jgi:hypothetical protein